MLGRKLILVYVNKGQTIFKPIQPSRDMIRHGPNTMELLGRSRTIILMI